MTAADLILADLLASAVAAAGWLGAGATAAARRPRPAAGLLVLAMVGTVARAATAIALAGHGWWFAQEKLLIAAPLALASGLAAAGLAGPPLLRAVRPAGKAGVAGPADRAGRPRVVVPLLGAGYAGAAGILVTLLVGFPAGWADALIASALAGTSTLVTWRLAGRPGAAPPRWATAAVLAAGLIGAALAVVPAPGDPGGTPAAPGPGAGTTSVVALRGAAAPAPGGVVRRYTLVAGTTTVTLASGRRVSAWAYGGQVPGPPVTATVGDLIEVTLRNADIGDGVTLHWHGYDVPAAEDGAPGLTQDAVPPGGEHVYRFLADRAGTYWYHTHQASHRGVRMGLYGTLVVNPRGPRPAGLDLTVPVHTLAGTVLLGDADGRVRRTVAPGTAVRLRVVNTDSVPRRLTVAGTPYRLAAVDGTDLTGPGELGRVGLRLAAGGRHDLTFTMPGGPVLLLVDDDRAGGLSLVPRPGGPDPAAPDTARWPELDLVGYGAPAETPFGPASRYDRDLTLVLDRGLARTGRLPRYAYTVNGRAFPHVPAQVVRSGELVALTVVNRGLDTHPWHLHGHRVLVLARDGRPVTGSPLWLDSFDVRPGQVWRVGFRATNPGVLDEPLPQPLPRRRGHGAAPALRRRDDPVPRRARWVGTRLSRRRGSGPGRAGRPGRSVPSAGGGGAGRAGRPTGRRPPGRPAGR